MLHTECRNDCNHCQLCVRHPGRSSHGNIKMPSVKLYSLVQSTKKTDRHFMLKILFCCFRKTMLRSGSQCSPFNVADHIWVGLQLELRHLHWHPPPAAIRTRCHSVSYGYHAAALSLPAMAMPQRYGYPPVTGCFILNTRCTRWLTVQGCLGCYRL
jgi:hypothetical protein